MAGKQLSVKLVVVGDGAVGKTCLLIAYATNKPPTDYIPTIFDNYVVNVGAADCNIELSLWDTAGQEDFDRIRPLSYSGADVFLLCFSLVSRTSLQNVQYKWMPELRQYCPETPVILVGTKADLRCDPTTLDQLKASGQAPVDSREGLAMAQAVGAAKYTECSAITGENVKLVFDTAIKTVVLASPAEKRRKWFGQGRLKKGTRRSHGKTEETRSSHHKCVLM